MVAKNLLYIVTDDLRADLMPRAFSNRSSGFTTFAQAHCTVPLCVPSRGSFMTGRQPDRLAGSPTIVDLLNRARFVTAGVGKIFHLDEAGRHYSLPWPSHSANLFERPCARHNGSVIVWRTAERASLDSRACAYKPGLFPDSRITTAALQLLETGEVVLLHVSSS